MNDTVQQLALEKNHLYRDQYRRVLRWNMLLVVIALALTGILIFMNVTARQSRYYASTVNGYVIPLHSLSEPVITPKVLMQWGEVAARTAYNFDFAHYQTELQQAKPYFTPDAWKQFNKALHSSGLLDQVIKNKLVMNSVVSGPPVILSQGKVHGAYTWTLQMPILLTFTSANENTQGHLIVTMTISRVPVLAAPKGIQISDFEVQTVGSVSNEVQ
ncbi:MAG: type IVB secretion system apparatus protein IcmL/DotI [Gammaproteobacteria bacterium]|nr:type IVB secretion system apparatus protein IcmL/DotI [Gammaproteobacteria bacterium]